GGEDDPPCSRIRGRQGQLLLRQRKLAVQGDDFEGVVTPLDQAPRALDLATTGQEREHIAFVVRQRLRHHAREVLLDTFLHAGRGVLDAYRETASRTAHPR